MANRRIDRLDGGRSLVDRVHAATREAILSGVHPPGSRLLVSMIAAENGVSTIPVREAIRRLESERLVVVELNRGATVTPISVDDLRDVYETRIVMECHALRRAYPLLDRDVIRAARTDLARMTALLRAGRDHDAFLRHRAFHYALYEPAGSPWSMHVIAQLWSGAERYLRLSAGMRDSPEQFAAEHEEVLAAVAEGDADAAVARLEEHLRRTQRLLDAAYGDEPAPQPSAA